jgi:hypothetical protein
MGQETETMKKKQIDKSVKETRDERNEARRYAEQLKCERDEARAAYEAETLSTAELVAENLHLDKRWKTDNFYFCGMMQLLKENGITHGSKDLIDAGRRYEESESQREAAGTADEKPDGQAENV